MKFDREFLDFCYNSILVGFSPFLFEGDTFFSKHLSSREIFLADAHCLLFRERLKKNEVLGEYDILKDCISKGTWSKSKDDDILFVRKQIEQKQKIIPKLFLLSQVKQVKGEIKQLEKSLLEKESEKQSLLVNSIEYKTRVEKRDYIVYSCLYKSLEERYWASFDDFLSMRSETISALVNKYYECMSLFTEPLLRAIAKDTDARLRFKEYIPPMDSSIKFFELKQWCDFYSSIYELTDKPDDAVLQDDEKLDSWVISRRSAQKTSVNSSGGYTGICDASKEDMEILGGTDRSTLLQIATEENKK